MGNSDDFNMDSRLHPRSAAGWYVRLSSANHRFDDLASFNAWLEEEPANRAAFAAATAALNVVNAAADQPELLAMRQAALARTAPAASKAPWFVRRQLLAALAASVLLGLAATWPSIDRDAPSAAIAFQTNQYRGRVVALSDGSRVTLDRRTRLTVSYGPSRRDIMLLDGQARFQVAHDERRPFVVIAGSRSVRATGTDFNVERPVGSTIVTLVEGGVIVAPTESESGRHRQANTVKLVPGDQLEGRDEGGDVVRKVHPQDVLAWQQGKLSFNNERLADVITRINRYSERKIVADDDVAELRINGVFDLDDSIAFAEAVTSLLPVEASTRTNEVIRLRKRIGT